MTTSFLLSLYAVERHYHLRASYFVSIIHNRLCYENKMILFKGEYFKTVNFRDKVNIGR